MLHGAFPPTEQERETNKAEDEAEKGHTLSETPPACLCDLINYSVSCGHSARLGFARFSVSHCLFFHVVLLHTPDNTPLVPASLYCLLAPAHVLSMLRRVSL